MSELFDATEYVVPDPDAGLGEDARRTRRSERALAAGWHPVTHLLLHPDAPSASDRAAPGPRCGTCVHMVHQASYLKCDLVPLTHGPATDTRAWWPACRSWEAT